MQTLMKSNRSLLPNKSMATSLRERRSTLFGEEVHDAVDIDDEPEVVAIPPPSPDKCCVCFEADVEQVHCPLNSCKYKICKDCVRKHPVTRCYVCRRDYSYEGIWLPTQPYVLMGFFLFLLASCRSAGGDEAVQVDSHGVVDSVRISHWRVSWTKGRAFVCASRDAHGTRQES